MVVIVAMWLLPSMSRLSLGPRRDVVATGMPPAAVPGQGKKQKTAPGRSYYERQTEWIYFQRLSAEERAALFAEMAVQYQKYGLDPDGAWVKLPLPEALLRDIFGAAWNTTPIEDHWKWKYKQLTRVQTDLVERRKLKKKGADAIDDESAPGRKRAKRLASQERWKQSFDIQEVPRGAMQDVDDRVKEDLKRQFPVPPYLRDTNAAQKRVPACCMQNR